MEAETGWEVLTMLLLTASAAVFLIVLCFLLLKHHVCFDSSAIYI